jgi:hypothetical protein
MDVQELRPGLWRWTAPHPDWTPEARWERDVGSLYYEAPDAVVLIDPLVPAGEEEAFFAALDRDVDRLGSPVHVLQTIPWHERSAQELVARYGASTEVPPGVESLVIDGIEFPEARETVLWLHAERALVFGDAVLGRGGGELQVCPASWIVSEGGHPVEFLASLQRLLDLPIELVLVSHGEPVVDNARDALERALAS